MSMVAAHVKCLTAPMTLRLTWIAWASRPIDKAHLSPRTIIADGILSGAAYGAHGKATGRPGEVPTTDDAIPVVYTRPWQGRG